MTRNAVIIGSGNIGTDLLEKVHRRAGHLEVVAMVGIDPDSDGLRRASGKGIKPIATGVAGLLDDEDLPEVHIAFDATSAKAHVTNDRLLKGTDIRLIDLTPAALGPFVVPAVNMPELLDERNVNMVTCGGQATIPIVAAVSSVAPVAYAEIVASIASRSAGPGTRKNIDEFTQTTARAIEVVGRAERGKAMIILNPAKPPLLMRNTVYCVARTADGDSIGKAVTQMVKQVQEYVPGYRLKQDVQCEVLSAGDPRRRLTAADDAGQSLILATVFLEISGAGDYLPAYAGNLDIMTSAALRVGESLAGG